MGPHRQNTASRPTKEASLADLFRGNSQLLVYHFMFGPDYAAGARPARRSRTASTASSSTWPTTTSRSARCRAPCCGAAGVQATDGVVFPWASSFGSDFNYDFQVTFTEEQQQSGVVEHASARWIPAANSATHRPLPSMARTWRRLRGSAGMSAFALEDGVAYHTYSAATRAGRPLGDRSGSTARRAGATETMVRGLGDLRAGVWARRHDEYDSE